ncbi:DUF1365 domain-containing protein [Tepidimonas charontis]|uniref:DUF1365 domain-containing protein n=1 Tax=Tepidimonas charontis TaxID=2267262 RepID=A0A554XHW6_9BURK|nr:DUF1365 domain-containing protein [Tepidimonas charontis]TSE35424.1 hypothetical protein Tchar_00829 [Tepidimonas charontis]
MTTQPSAAPASLSDTVLIGEGWVRHHRLRPREHAFAHRTWFLLLPMHRLAAAAAQAGLALNRRALISFDDRDHGDGRSPERGGALAWLRELLAQHGIADADGPVWLHTYPRVLGYAFKPVSFWYCHCTDGALRAIVAEVNNTFGERHCYLLDEPAWGHTLQAPKRFHVSPFLPVAGGYRFRFLRTSTRPEGERTVVRIEYDDEAGPLLRTSVAGTLRPAQASDWSALLWRYRWHSAMVIARIHAHALTLWRKGVRIYPKPAAPAEPVTPQSPRPLLPERYPT